MTRAAQARAPRASRTRAAGRRHASVLFAAPLALVYHLGLLVTDVRNGADTLTSVMLDIVDRSVLGYVTFLCALAFLLYALARRLEARGEFAPKDLFRVLGEAALLGLGMRFVVGFLTSVVVAVPCFVGARRAGPIDVLVISSGAGFHEELVFRGLFFAGGAVLLVALGMSRVRALVAAALVSSLLFSLAHYVGPLGDPFALSSFVFRALAGLYLALVFHFRGFAVAAWTHALYDVGVLV